MKNLPLFPIGVVSELLNVHPETVRVWERYGVVKLQRRSGKRFYSETDLKRLRFIKRLIAEELNLPGVHHYIYGFTLVGIWMIVLPVCIALSLLRVQNHAGKEEGVYCQAYDNEDTCSNCEFRKESKEHKA